MVTTEYNTTFMRNLITNFLGNSLYIYLATSELPWLEKKCCFVINHKVSLYFYWPQLFNRWIALSTRPQLFKSWIALSTGYHYPVDKY